MASHVVGRARELGVVERFLDALGEGSAVLVFEGAPGIGKTTLVRAAIEAARTRGAQVLSCAPSAPETRLSYAALGDLLAGIEMNSLEQLSAPQRHALDAALLRADPGAAGVDGRAVATGVLSLLDELARKRSVLVAIDDSQWLDGPSARVIEFCARRLKSRVGLIASRRLGEEGASAAALIVPRDRERVWVRELGPLEVGELGQVLLERADHPLGRRALMRVYEASGGNPFYALELARALPADGPLPPALPLPASLDEIVAARMAGHAPDVEELLLTVAGMAEPTVELLERALGPSLAERLDDAELSGMIELDRGRVRFTHPLLASGVYARAPAVRRRAMHRRLGAIVPDPEERARHLAYAGSGPEVVAALDEAARHVRARGAPDAAAELLELALERSGDPELRVRAAEHHFDAGEPQRARALLEEALRSLPAGEARADALLLLAELRYHDDSYEEARVLLERARAEPGARDLHRAMIEGRLSFLLFSLGLAEESAAAARSAVALAERIEQPGLLAEALSALVVLDFCLGRGLDEQRLATALELEDPGLRTAGELRPSHGAAFVLGWVGRLDEARRLLDRLAHQCAVRGEDHDLAWMGFTRVWVELWSGNLARAAELAEEAVERLLALGTSNARGLAFTIRAQVEAAAGRMDAARRAGEEAVALFESTGWRIATAWPMATLGSVDLLAGDYEAAAERLGPLSAIARETFAEPIAGSILVHGDAAEALIATGRVEEADELVSWLEERGATLDRPWATAVGARCRGLLLAAAGDVDSAEEAMGRALAAHERLPMPIERARSLLVLGRIRRRLRKRRAAKAALDEALRIFDAVGSSGWAEQTRAEIACLGLRPSAQDRLTPSEERVARLAAAGLTNREVAASLSITAKTVEAHLARAYRKLGIRSRAELGSRMTQGDVSNGRGSQGRSRTPT